MTYPIKILANFMFPVTTYEGKWKEEVPEGSPPGTPPVPVIVEGGRQDEHHFTVDSVVDDLDLDTKRLFVAKGLAQWTNGAPADAAPQHQEQE